eukprot:709995-Alexandrium_andersonii.AAC.1
MESAGGRLRGAASSCGPRPVEPLGRPAQSWRRPGGDPTARSFWRFRAAGPRGSRTEPRSGDHV